MPVELPGSVVLEFPQVGPDDRFGDIRVYDAERLEFPRWRPATRFDHGPDCCLRPRHNGRGLDCRCCTSRDDHAASRIRQQWPRRCFYDNQGNLLCDQPGSASNQHELRDEHALALRAGRYHRRCQREHHLDRRGRQCEFVGATVSGCVLEGHFGRGD